MLFPRLFLEHCLRYLRQSEIKVLLVLLSHQPNPYPGRARIGELAGLKRTAVSKALSGMADVGIFERKQRRNGCGWKSNYYQFPDLANPFVVEGICKRLVARDNSAGRSEDRAREHGRRQAANASAGRSPERAHNHHQVKKENLNQSTVPDAHFGPSFEGDDEPLTATESFHDIEALLPDNCSVDQMQEVLERAGVHPGRAFRFARHPNAQPALLGEVLSIASDPKIRNPGAYICTLLTEFLERARRCEVTVARQDLSDSLEDADKLIDTWSYSKIRDLTARDEVLKNLKPDLIRSDPAFRRRMVELIAARNDMGVL